MTSVIEAVTSVLGSLIDEEPKPPLHVGEVMNCWTLLTIFQEGHSLYQAGLNTTTDSELRHAIENAIEASKADIKILKDFLIREGISLPPVTEDKPISDPNEIPLGVKLTDEEIANSISAKVATCISLCGTTIAQCVRNDVGIMALQFQTQLMKYGAVLKSLMRKRGWLKVPPYYYPPGLPDQ